MQYESEYYGVMELGDSLMHHGVKGQKHGTRRWQYEDGSLTPAGRIHYGVGEARDKVKTNKNKDKKALGTVSNDIMGKTLGINSNSSSHKFKNLTIEAARDIASIHSMSELDSAMKYYKLPKDKWKEVADEARRMVKEEKAAKKAVENLSKELNEQWEYGVIHNGKRINVEKEDFDWNNYRTISLDTLKKEKIGTCWDFVNYQHKTLNDLGIKNDSYLLMMDLRTKDDPDRIVTHTFTTFELDGKQYWLESAMYSKRGIHEIKSFEDAAESVKSTYTSEPKPYSIFKYNPDGLDNGLTGDEFIERATENNWVKDVNTKRR